MYCFRQNAAPPEPATASIAGITRVTTTPLPVRTDTFPAVATTTPEHHVLSSVLTNDSDGDHSANSIDNCHGTYNPGKTDGNRNGIGDACDNGYGQLLFNATATGGNETEDTGTGSNAGNYSPDSEKNLPPLKVNVGHVEFRTPFDEWFRSLYSVFFGKG